MKFMHSILLLLLSSSCLADSSQQSVAAEQPVADGPTENAAKNGATTVDKSQNKRGAPDIPVIIGAPAQHTAYVNHATVVATPLSGHATHGASLGSVPFGYGHHTALATGTGHILQAQPQYNYASAVPQLTYAHYPQYQLYHNQHQQHQQQGTGQLTHDYHPVATATVHELPQQQAAYAHQQPIYAHHPATTIHYSAIPLVSGQPNYQGQHHHQHQQHQQQQQYPLTHTQAIHYQPAAGGQPSVPIVHQAPIATINQVHQAHQLYAAQGQLAKYPLSAHSVYGAAGGGVPAVQNQIYSTAPSYATYYQQQQQQRPAASGSAVAGQILPATVATPAHHQLKPFVPVTTATTTHHHGNGISYSTFTQPGTGAAFQGQTKAQSVLQTQPVYYNTLQQPATYFRQPVAIPAQQQQQQPRVQVFSTVATPTVQKTAGPVFAANQFSHPVPPYPAYAFGHQAHQGTAGLISGAGPTLYHQQHQHQQSAAASAAGKLAYLPSPVNVGGLVAGGGRGSSIYLLH